MARARYQPQGVVRLEARNRFVPGAIVFPLAAYPWSLGAVPGVPTTISGGTAVRGGPFGKAYATTAAALDLIRLGTIPSMTTDQFTALVLVKFDSLPPSSTAFTIFESGSRADASYMASNGSFQFRLNANAGLDVIKDNTVAVGSTPNGVFPLGKMVAVAVSYASGVLRVGVNGRLVHEVGVVQSFASGNFTLLTKDGTASEKGPAEAALFAYWPYAMSQADVATITGDPLQLFAVPDEEDAVADGPVDSSVSPGRTALALTGYAPSVVRGVTISAAPGAAALAIAGYAPSVTQGMTTTVSPAPGALAVVGYAPTVSQTAARGTSPAPAGLTITGYAPTVTRGASLVVAAGAPAALTVTGYAPTITQANNVTPHYTDATIMRLSVVRAVVDLGPDHLYQTAGLP